MDDQESFLRKPLDPLTAVNLPLPDDNMEVRGGALLRPDFGDSVEALFGNQRVQLSFALHRPRRSLLLGDRRSRSEQTKRQDCDRPRFEMFDGCLPQGPGASMITLPPCVET